MPTHHAPAWEYRVELITHGVGQAPAAPPGVDPEAARELRARDLTRTFDGLGADGWELVQIWHHYAVFKRPRRPA